MKNFFSILLLTLSLVICQGCGSKHDKNHEFVGHFTDEYEDEFTLNEDMTATILFKGAKEPVKTTWYNGDHHERAYATIEYDGNPEYYYLRDESLYKHREDMEEGRCEIKITYKE